MQCYDYVCIYSKFVFCFQGTMANRHLNSNTPYLPRPLTCITSILTLLANPLTRPHPLNPAIPLATHKWHHLPLAHHLTAEQTSLNRCRVNRGVGLGVQGLFKRRKVMGSTGSHYQPLNSTHNIVVSV